MASLASFLAEQRDSCRLMALKTEWTDGRLFLGSTNNEWSMHEWMSEWVNEWMSEWINHSMDHSIDQAIHQRRRIKHLSINEELEDDPKNSIDFPSILERASWEGVWQAWKLGFWKDSQKSPSWREEFLLVAARLVTTSLAEEDSLSQCLPQDSDETLRWVPFIHSLIHSFTRCSQLARQPRQEINSLVERRFGILDN